MTLLFSVFASTCVPETGSVRRTTPLACPLGTVSVLKVGIRPFSLQAFSASARDIPERSGIVTISTPLLMVSVIFAFSFTRLGSEAVCARGYWSHTTPAAYSVLYSSSV